MAFYKFEDEDYFAVEIAKKVAKRFLTNPQLPPSQIMTLGKALIALKKLPESTPEIFIEFGISYRNGTEDFDESKFFTFGLYVDAFEITTGGSVYNKDIGGDTISGPGWRISLDNISYRELNLYQLEDSINEYLNLGATINVYDEIMN